MYAYLDPASGISGDMFLGCLVSAGWSVEALEVVIRAVLGDAADGAWSVEHKAVMKGPFRATLIDVQVTETEQPHRHLSDIRALLEKSTLSPTVIQNAIAVFTRLADAEGMAHGMSPEEVHFHEVGALDSIIDIVGVCAGIEALGLTLHSAPLPMGHGYTNSDHGLIPLPAPATLELLTQANAPIKPAPGSGELVTPTGAALVIHFTEGRWFQPEMHLHKIGIGAGQKEFAWANIARLWLGSSYNPRRTTTPSPATTHHHAKPHDGKGHSHHDQNHPHTHPTNDSEHGHSHEHHHDAHVPVSETHPTAAEPSSLPSHSHRMALLETNIDDMNPEFYAAVSEKLLANGARDVWYTPIHMKKNRPGIKLSVLVSPDNEERIARMILRDTSTLGMRVLSVGRHEAQRRMESVNTPYGEIPVKLKILDDEVVAAVPEYEPCKLAAQTYNVSTREVYEAAAAVGWYFFIAPQHPSDTNTPN